MTGQSVLGIMMSEEQVVLCQETNDDELDDLEDHGQEQDQDHLHWKWFGTKTKHASILEAVKQCCGCEVVDACCGSNTKPDDEQQR